MQAIEFYDLCHVKDTVAEIVQIEARFKKETGLNLNQAFAVCCLGKSPMSATELAHELRIAGPSLSRILKTLSQKGLIVKDSNEEDSRQKVLSLSPRGKSLVATLKACEERVFSNAKTEAGLAEQK